MQGHAKEEILKLIREKGIKILNLCHIPEDCRLKTLSFAVKNGERLNEILEFGERVDGSSLFSYIDPAASDVYILPRTETAFIDPFSAIPALNVMCQYLDADGKSLEIAHENVLQRAEEKLHSSTGISLNALAELEFYLISRQDETSLTEISERNYHESAPFARLGDVRNEILTKLEDSGFATKYGHSEVGRFQSREGYLMEQHEIEFLPQSLEKMSETVTIAKWVARNICAKRGISVSFMPKVALEHAGNGMHLHLCGIRRNRNVISDSRGNLTDEARQMIGGILKFARSLSAFGNTTPVSYLRFISRKESPMHVCWGAKNRLALVRIPLWWNHKGAEANGECRRTFEFRGPDPSANSYLLFAGIALAVQYGLKNPREAMRVAESLNADKTGKKRYAALPLSCAEAAVSLRKDRGLYEADDVFPRTVVDGVIRRLESYEDADMWKKLAGETEKVDELLWKYLKLS
jgi:glutamine synthetase